MDRSKRSLQELHPKREYIPLLILLSVVFLVLGLNLPILTVRKLWEQNTFSVLSGIVNLWKEHYYFLAAIVFFFSIIFPIVKLVTLFVIWFIELTDLQRKLILNWLGALGKWSMLDVFVAAIIIVSIKLGALASAKAENGIYYFGLSILLAMIVTALQSSLARGPQK